LFSFQQIYSRNSEDNTGKYPDIAALFPKALSPGTKSIVIDAEAVAYDPATKKVLPFQILSTRARKDVTIESIKVSVCVFAFDCLYLNGKALLQDSLTERRNALYAGLNVSEGELEFATAKVGLFIFCTSRFRLFIYICI
jgi:DNA ligase-1